MKLWVSLSMLEKDSTELDYGPNLAQTLKS